MVRRALLGSLLAAALLWSAPSFGQDECSKVLDKELATDRIVQTSSRGDRLAAFYQMCSKTYEEFNDTYGFQSGAQYYGIGGTGDYNQANYEQHRQTQCTTTNLQQSSQASSYYFSSTPNSQALADWQECIARQQLYCLVQPINGGDSTVVVRIHNGIVGKSDAFVSSSSRTGGKVLTKLECHILQSKKGLKKGDDCPPPTPEEFLSSETIIPHGETLVMVTRDPKAPWSAVLNIIKDGEAAGLCSVFAPAEREAFQECPWYDAAPMKNEAGCASVQCPDTFVVQSYNKYPGSDRVLPGPGTSKVYCRSIGNTPHYRDCMVLEVVDPVTKACVVTKYFDCLHGLPPGFDKDTYCTI